MELTELIARAPWREAVTYRDTWPHEYVLLQKDDQRELLEVVCQRLRDGEGVPCRFFAMRNEYLFIGDYKYWLMTPPDQVDWDDEEVLNPGPSLPGPPRLRHPGRRQRDEQRLPVKPGAAGLTGFVSAGRPGVGYYGNESC